MARRGKQRSQQQRQHTGGMRRQVLLRSPSTENIIEPVDPRAASKTHKKYVKEACEQRRLARNAHKREERLKGKVDEQAKVIDSLKSELDGVRDENIELEDRLEGSKGEVYAWKDEARKRKAEVGRLKDRVRRFDGRLSRAVGETAEAAGEEMASGVLVIKDKYREAVADLNCQCSSISVVLLHLTHTGSGGRDLKGTKTAPTYPSGQRGPHSDLGSSPISTYQGEELCAAPLRRRPAQFGAPIRS